MLTSPKETAPRQIDRMSLPPERAREPTPDLRSGQDRKNRTGLWPAARRRTRELPRTGEGPLTPHRKRTRPPHPSRARGEPLDGAGGGPLRAGLALRLRPLPAVLD